MQHSAQGSYTIEQQNNILLINARGPFNEVTTEQYYQDIKLITKNMIGNRWGIISLFSGDTVFLHLKRNKN